MNTSELIYDWNHQNKTELHPAGPVRLTDETLRDGLQSPSVRDPSIEQKIEILHLMEALGINTLDLGLPGAGARAVEHVTALAREIVGAQDEDHGRIAPPVRTKATFVPSPRSCRRPACRSRSRHLSDRVRFAVMPKAGMATSFFRLPKRPSNMRFRSGSKSCMSPKTQPAAIRRR